MINQYIISTEIAVRNPIMKLMLGFMIVSEMNYGFYLMFRRQYFMNTIMFKVNFNNINIWEFDMDYGT